MRQVLRTSANVPARPGVAGEGQGCLIFRGAGGGPAYTGSGPSKALAPDGAEQALIERMLELREQGLRLRHIAHALEVEIHQPKHGGRWDPTTIGRALARKVA